MEFPIEVNEITLDDSSEQLKSNGLVGGRRGRFVSVRPCGDEYGGKTYLGIYLGDLALSFIFKHEAETGELKVRHAMHNPMIYIPELKDVVYGCGSWWGEIESPEHLREITDDDIENVWYVQALKQFSENDDA